MPWGALRHWLHDLASELWAATRDQTLPTDVSLDQVWITAQGHAVLIDEPWPGGRTVAERMPRGDIGAQQRFLSVIAAFHAVVHPNRGLHDRLVGTWVVRR